MAWRFLLGLASFCLLFCSGADVVAQEGDALRFFQQNPARSLFRTAPVQRRPDYRLVEPREFRERAVRRRPMPEPEPELAERPAVVPTMFVHVVGDALAEALAQGLKEHFAETKPEVGVQRKIRPNSGLVRDDHFDWQRGLRDLAAAADRVDMLVVMVGSNDRQPLRDETGAHEFGTDRWKELYARRIDDLLAVVREKRWPVLMVGMPVMQEPRLSAGMVVVNALLKERAQRAGVVFVDIWEGFATEKGEYSSTGPDVNGATVRLRTSDGILFTRAGARKLGFFVGKEAIERLGRELPPAVADLPADLSDQIRRELPGAAPPGLGGGLLGGFTLPELPELPVLPAIGQRPLAGPVLALGAAALSPGGVLLRGRVFTPATEMGILVEQVFAYGRPPPAKPGRADDFAWPRRPIDRRDDAAASQVSAPASAPIRAPVSAAAGSRP
jgi:hypothetical protein